jgi:hypothetical protein
MEAIKNEIEKRKSEAIKIMPNMPIEFLETQCGVDLINDLDSSIDLMQKRAKFNQGKSRFDSIYKGLSRLQERRKNTIEYLYSQRVNRL